MHIGGGSGGALDDNENVGGLTMLFSPGCGRGAGDCKLSEERRRFGFDLTSCWVGGTIDDGENVEGLATFFSPECRRGAGDRKLSEERLRFGFDLTSGGVGAHWTTVKMEGPCQCFSCLDMGGELETASCQKKGDALVLTSQVVGAGVH